LMNLLDRAFVLQQDIHGSTDFKDDFFSSILRMHFNLHSIKSIWMAFRGLKMPVPGPQ